MIGAAASDHAATAPQERRWRWFVLALVLMVSVTAASSWTPSLALVGGTVRLLLPIEQFALLVLVAVAACAVVGWWAGARLSVALLWVAMALWVLWKLPLPFTGYGAFLRGWSLSLGASFGLVCLTTRARPFLGRALAATALLGLESLLALGLGWAAYHRLSRVRIGPPLSALRTLRFNDQLVWGLVVGATLMLLPTLVEWRAVGANLICFFGTLYALRGVGVLAWWIPDRVAAALPLALFVLVVLLGPVVVLSVLMAATFVLGLGDTWRDFRAGAHARRTGSLR